MQHATLLNQIHAPADVKELNFEQMEQLCAEIRARMIRTVAKTGGHLASSLGVVEITVALHKVFRSPVDQIVWDVGHQSYAHKMLTGRLDLFDSLRQENGLSGFPRSTESEHDIFLAGHSSTSVSVASGLARAKYIKQEPGHAIAVIGDGAFTNGMVYEALNNIGRYKDRMIIVLNDNEMSISHNVGTLARYLAHIRSKNEYFTAKDCIERGVKSVPLLGKGLYKLIAASKATVKDLLYNSNLFEDFGFTYLGPVNGHDIRSLCAVFERARSINCPVVVHVETKKGKGYIHAERNPSMFHGISKFDIHTGQPLSSSIDSFSSVFGAELTRLAQQDDAICAITAAMKHGTGLSEFATAFPSRFFDVGIAEEHAVTFSAGLACNGMRPVLAVYSTFLQRGYDQILHDLAIEPKHVVLGVDRAGLVGEDGETHQGLFDTAFLSNIPQVTILAPSHYADLRGALQHALYDYHGPVAVRYPRGREESFDQSRCNYTGFPAYHLTETPDADTLIVTYGREFVPVIKAAERLASENILVSVLKINRIAPLDDTMVTAAAAYQTILFVEEGIQQGGIGEHFGTALLQVGFHGRFLLRAVNGAFVPQSSVASALQRLGLDCDGVCEFVRSNVGEKNQ